MSVWAKHKIFETNPIILLLGSLIVISIGGIVEIVPLFYLRNTIEAVDGVRPYTPLELAGRNIYVREGCYNCHSQMVRSLRDEVERYGHYSLAAESMYDRPFQWGSKRTGPDLARVGGKYSDTWHLDHLNSPSSVVPATIMPAYPWLAETELELSYLSEDLRVQQILGVPYTDEMVENAARDATIQGTLDPLEADDLLASYPNANIRDFTGIPSATGRLSEADALIAYLQSLGTAIDFNLYDDSANIR